MDYKCIFFDLDHTLWDYETNSRETLHDLYHHFDLCERGVGDVESFCSTFREVNLHLWNLYDKEIINTEVIRGERFKKVLEKFMAFEQKLSDDLSEEYLVRCPAKSNLMPYAADTLHYLSSRYNLTVITNGFEETQQVKLCAGNIQHFFDHVITSQKAGHKKPAREIFEFALKLNGIQSGEAIMVGDNLITDVAGARNALIDTVFFNPEEVDHLEEVNYEVKCLSELRDLL